jgi:hypothetical protein
MNLIALIEKEFSEVRAVLSGDASDERNTRPTCMHILFAIVIRQVSFFSFSL